MAPAAFAILVEDYIHHDTGDPRDPGAVLDTEARVSWAWKVVQSSKFRRTGEIIPLRVDVDAERVNQKDTGRYVEMLRRATVATKKTLPLLAKTWDPSAPDTHEGNISAKLSAVEEAKSFTSKQIDSDDEGGAFLSVYGTLGVGMCDLAGSKRAARAMLVASVFAAELSQSEGVPAVVIGRPPGHHATCSHRLEDKRRYWVPSPRGKLDNSDVSGGCFYPSCFLALVHSVRKGYTGSPAYIDVDAHMPDGTWRELDNLCKVDRERRNAVFNGSSDACKGVLFASIHTDFNPDKQTLRRRGKWKSVRCKIPKGTRRGFEIVVNEELLPSGVGHGVPKHKQTKQKRVLQSFNRWKKSLLHDIHSFNPDGLFVGMGFDLHKKEMMIDDKREGLGLEARHYRQIFEHPYLARIRGPVVLTFEGGYTKAGVTDGMEGVLDGLVKLARRKGTSKAFAKDAVGKRKLFKIDDNLKRSRNSCN